jgi:hypothetical protein
MDAAVHDEAVQRDGMEAAATRSSPSVGDAWARQASEPDDITRGVSKVYPGNKPIVSSSGKSMARRRGGALRTALFLLREAATAGIAVTILGLLILLF